MQRNWLSLWIILLGAYVAVIGSAGALYAQANADWTEPFPPFKIAGNLYYIGSKGLANYLIATPQGHILINSDLEKNVPLIRASVEKLGFKFTDIKILLISHAHWDHMGGIDLFPKAAVWIQKEEFRYYTLEAWQPMGQNDGIDPEDVQALVRLNTEGRLRLVDGDNVEILPGIRAYTGARHTYASQYLVIEGSPRFVLASDNCYLYRNLTEHKASATFSEADWPANVRNQERMIQLAGSPERVIPGHDALQFQKFPTQGRVARIR